MPLPPPLSPAPTEGGAHAPGAPPAPGPEERARSERLARLIRAEIEAAGGAVAFARFMELALYAPGLGYYCAPRRIFGDRGDFTTAPELGSLFARCLARQCHEVLAELGGGDILEAGAGSGAMAADLLLEIEALNGLPDNYMVLELSAELRARQKETMERKAAHLLNRVRWLDDIPAPGFRGVMLANELLDAMPVQRFRLGDRGPMLLQVGWDGSGFAWREKPAPPELRARLDSLSLPEGYTSEIGPAAEAWIKGAAERLAAGVLLLIDYGFPRAEFYHPQRAGGTLMCHYRHQAHDDPLILVGLQDITAHVDFTAVAEAAAGAGLSVLGYTTQAAFVLAFAPALVAGSDPRAARRHLELTTQIKKLTLPHEMGELFKVIALGRGVERSLSGFALVDQRVRL